MDLEQVLSDTRRAYQEAGIDDPDLSYTTQDYLEEMEANASEEDPPSAEQSEEVPDESPEPIATWGSLYYDVTFSGLRFYGTIGGDRYVCNGTWRRTSGWSQRAIVGRCSNRNSTIWRIG